MTASLENIAGKSDSTGLDNVMARLSTELGEEVTLDTYTSDMVELYNYYNTAVENQTESIKSSTSAAKDLTSVFLDLADALNETRMDLFGLGGSDEQAFKAIQGQYASTYASAMTGNQSALGNLSGFADDYAGAGADYFTDSQAYKNFIAGIQMDLYQAENVALSKGGFADGGWSVGPQSGHLELLHGTEKISTLSDVKKEQELLMMIVNVMGDQNTKLNKIVNAINKLMQGDDKLRVNDVDVKALLTAVLNSTSDAIKTEAA